MPETNLTKEQLLEKLQRMHRRAQATESRLAQLQADLSFSQAISNYYQKELYASYRKLNQLEKAGHPSRDFKT